MKALLATMIVAGGLVISSASAAGALAIDGQGDTLTGRDGAGRRDDRAQVPGLQKPPKPGTPRISDRGRGDRPPKPALWYIPGVGACITGRPSFSYTDPVTGAPANLAACPGAAGATGPPPPTPLEAAYQAWYWETRLPSPTMATSPPKGAITGLDLYLSIGGAQTLTFEIPALGYNVRLDVTSVYDVNWGDPRPDDTPLGRAVTKGHRTQGGPYPKGDLRHQYIERGSVTIEVTQRWTATWSAGGQSGTIADRLATSATITIPVQEIQAVLRGP